MHTKGDKTEEWDKFPSEESANIRYEGNLKHCKLCWKKRDGAR